MHRLMAESLLLLFVFARQSHAKGFVFQARQASKPVWIAKQVCGQQSRQDNLFSSTTFGQSQSFIVVVVVVVILINFIHSQNSKGTTVFWSLFVLVFVFLTHHRF